MFDAEDTVRASLAAAAAVRRGAVDQRGTSTRGGRSGLLLATDVADYLVAKGLPFRDAHEVVGALVRRLVEERPDFDDLTLDEWRAHSPLFDADVRQAITAAASVAKKRTPQSTIPTRSPRRSRSCSGWLAAQPRQNLNVTPSEPRQNWKSPSDEVDAVRIVVVAVNGSSEGPADADVREKNITPPPTSMPEIV